MDKKTSHIMLAGTAYPARMVMGALLRFRRETGRDAAQMDPSDVGDLLLLLWCCTAAASHADGIPFTYDFDTFCDMITPGDVARWNEAMAEGQTDGEEEKKTGK